MKQTTLTIALGLFAMAAMSAGVMAREDKAAKETTLSGTLVCIGCTLNKEHGAKAQCSVYGHQHGLRTADGKIYTFLENDQSKDLRAGKSKDEDNLHGKKVEVTGTVFPKTQIIDVTSYKLVK
ncbi:MAG: hypothetical protein HY318_08980 [Armatimonadetes bacterium]|nr:hypothetical protein [Armatimonadota bacterium]